MAKVRFEYQLSNGKGFLYENENPDEVEFLKDLDAALDRFVEEVRAAMKEEAPCPTN